MITSIEQLEEEVKKGNYPKDAVWNMSPDQAFVVVHNWYKSHPDAKQMAPDVFAGREMNSIWEQSPGTIELVAPDGNVLLRAANLPAITAITL